MNVSSRRRIRVGRLLACAATALLVPFGTAAGQMRGASAFAVEVTPAEAARLGVEWARPESAERFAVAAAPAVVAVPPTEVAVVSAPVAGLVTRLLVAEGADVAAGEPLVELKSMELLGLEREYLDAESARRLAEAQLRRDEDLRREGIIAERRLEETKAQASAARLRAGQTREQLRLAGLADAELVKLAAQGKIDPTLTLKAPFAGTVVAREAALGAQIEAQQPVARIASLRTVWIEVRVPQESADAIAAGMRIAIDANGEQLAAEIFHVGRIVDPATQTVLVRGRLDNSRGLLRAGETLPARILGPGGSTTFAVPAPAVLRMNGGAYVFVRTPAGFALRSIRVLGRDDTRFHVQSDELAASAEVVVKGVSALKSLLLGDDEG